MNLYQNAKNQFIPSIRFSQDPSNKTRSTTAVDQQHLKVYKKYNCSGTPAFKSQSVGYLYNQKILHYYQHSKYQLNSFNLKIQKILGSHGLKRHDHF